MISHDDHKGLGDFLKQKYTDGIDRQKVVREVIRNSLLKDMIDAGLLTVEEGLALINGTPIKPRPWWVRAWRWVQRMIHV